MMNEGLYFKADSSLRIIYVWEVKQENRRLKIAARNIQAVTSHCYNLKFESRLKGNKLWLRKTERADLSTTRCIFRFLKTILSVCTYGFFKDQVDK